MVLSALRHGPSSLSVVFPSLSITLSVVRALAVAVTQAITGPRCSCGGGQSFCVSEGPILSLHLVL